MAYITLADFKAYRGGFTAGDTGSDAVIQAAINAAQKWIEARTEKVFEAALDSTVSVLYADHVFGADLYFDGWFAALTTLKNGDVAQTVIPSDQYLTLPGAPPYYGVRLRVDSGVSWTGEVLTVIGKAAYTATPPANVIEATKQMASYYYEKRNQPADAEREVITPEGIFLPSGAPKSVYELLAPYLPLITPG